MFPGRLFFENDCFHEIIFLCNSTALGCLRMTSKELSQGLLADPKTFRWIASLRKLPQNLLSESKSTLFTLAERLRIAETMSKLENNIHFDWGSADLRPDCHQPLRDFAALLIHHPHITAKIEGHCGIEAPPSSAQPMTQARTSMVVRALMTLGVPKSRLEAIGYGSDQPLTLAMGEPGEKNRRVEIFLTIGDVEIPPRRKKSEYVTVVKPTITRAQRELIQEVATALGTDEFNIQQYFEHFLRNGIELPTDVASFLSRFGLGEGDDEEEEMEEMEELDELEEVEEEVGAEMVL